MPCFGLDFLKEILQYYEQPSYQQWKQLQFLYNFDKLIKDFLFPLTILTLIVIWIKFIIFSTNKQAILVELIAETLGLMIIYLLGLWIKITRFFFEKTKCKLLNMLILFFEIFFLLGILQINFKDNPILMTPWNFVILGLLLKSFSQIYSSLIIKLLTFVFMIALMLFQTPFKLNYDNALYFSFLIIYYFFSVFLEEIIIIREFKALMSFLGLIETTLDAICIVNPSTKEIIFSNEKYDILSQKFSTYFATSNDNLTKSEQQFNLLLKLQLSLVEDKDQLHMLLNIFENENEHLKLKEIIFKANQNAKLNPKFNLPEDQLSKQQQNVSQIQNYFHQVKEFYQQNEDLEKKVFISDILIKYEAQNNQSLIHNQFQRQQSKQSKFRQNSNKSMKFSDFKNSPKYQKMYLKKNLDLDQKSPQSHESLNNSLGTDNKPSILTHKVRLLVQQITNFEFFGEAKNIEIYTIQELSSILLKQKLKKLENIKKNIMRSITHELLTYLTGAYGYLQELICEKERIGNESCQKLLQSSFNCLQLQIYKIQDLIDFKDILNETFEINTNSCNLYQQIIECVQLLKDQAISKGLSLSVDLLNREIFVKADKQKLNQLLLNLICNSIKFTKSNGKIIIRVRESNDFQCEELKNCEQNFKKIQLLDSSIFEIQIVDTGIGMTVEECGKLMKKLHYRIEEAGKVSKDSVGIGMGLSVCKEIVFKMSPPGLNLIFVESHQGMGSTFKFFLKEYCEDQFSIIMQSDKRLHFNNSSCEVQSESNINHEKVYELPSRMEFATSRNIQQPLIECSCNKILAVDDEQFILETISFQLYNLGFEVDRCYNGQQAIEFILKRHENRCSSFCKLYKCIFMDVNMPIMDGNVTVEKIRKMERLEILKTRLSIIAVTGFSGQLEKRQCLESGYDSVLNKPTNTEKLKDVLKKMNIEQYFINP